MGSNDSQRGELEKIRKINLSEEMINNILNLIKENLSSCAIEKSAKGRHHILCVDSSNKFSASDKEQWKIILNNQKNKLLEMLCNYDSGCELRPCCVQTYQSLSADPLKICEATRNWYARWLEERKYRITGSKCYSIFTYGKGKQVDWVKKAKNMLSAASYKTDAMKYGSNTEAEARSTYQALHPEYQVIESGLIISEDNPWLGYSPDGIIIHGSDKFLLEIKCPAMGKNNISEVVDNQLNKCLVKTGD
uniref:YqaJ viral recombinase domain-containing protein n=1 Tax=Trichogramma kaykai TaxID=54128 RepID=A0ABD2WQR0_9HYME